MISDERGTPRVISCLAATLFEISPRGLPPLAEKIKACILNFITLYKKRRARVKVLPAHALFLLFNLTFFTVYFKNATD
ncbi:MAG: hypothetical protein ACLSU0_02000 [Oscillospiraceae bacterium]